MFMHARAMRWAAGLLASLLAAGAVALAQDDKGREIPAPFAPFEYLIGSWKGTGYPTANRVRGWNETHAWAWKFEKGKPVGLSVTIDGGKTLTKGQITFDPASKTYTMAATDANRKPAVYSGNLDAAGKTLTLERVGATSEGAKQRLTLYPNANFIRYTFRVLEQEEGAPQFKPVIEAGVTKEGEAFAAGGGAADLPKCIVTGGAATMNVTYQGKSFPLCCSGCRDEFNESPEKYIKKLAFRNEAGGKTVAKPASTGKDDGSFDGLVDNPKPAASKGAKVMKEVPAKAEEAPKEKAETPRPKASDSSARAPSLLKLGQNLEKSGKPAAALGYYHQVVKTYPGTAAAKTAEERIKVLEDK